MAGGAYVAIAQGAGFSRDMVAGRGYIALAAMILGHWRPWPVLAACLGFGLLDAAAIRLQGVPIPGLGVGYGETKIVECHDLMKAIAEGTPASPSFVDGYRIALISDAILASAGFFCCR